MSKAQRLVTIVLWGLLVLVMVGVIGAGVWDRLHDGERGAQRAPSGLLGTVPGEPWPVPAFSLTDQNGKTITDRDLRGHPYVAAFIFTQCAGPCPIMSSKMSALQTSIRNPAVKLISFSVDPEHDTPAVLKDYADKFQADPNRWHFLTGAKETIFAIADGVKMAAMPAQGDQPIRHATYLLLVDSDGKVRSIYQTGVHADKEVMEHLAHDADLLAKESPGGKSR